MRRIILESPYSGSVDRNLTYLRAAMRDALSRDETPYASHGLLTQPGVLDDEVPEERERGIAAGFAWWDAAELVAVYTDLGISRGMQAAIERADRFGKPLVYRTIPGWSR